MKKAFLLTILVALILSGESALAAKARSISSDTDSAYHAQHLMMHLQETNCRATGNYIKTRNKANGSKVVGHLEQADEFILLDVKNGWAQIEVIDSDKTSPDSWDGMAGWVNSDYVDCTCSNNDYYNGCVKPSSSLSSLPHTIPTGWSHSSGSGGWSTELIIDRNGTFRGYYHDSNMGEVGKEYPHGTIYECTFFGNYSSVTQIDKHTYSFRITNLKTDQEINSRTIKDGVLHITMSPAGIKQGDTFLIYVPGTPLSCISQEHLSWLHGFIHDPIQSHALCNLTTGKAFNSGSELQTSNPAPETGISKYYCKVNNLRVRSKPVNGSIIGHIEQADQFNVHSIKNGWANITVTHSANTSPDSWVGLNGWVSMEHIGTLASSPEIQNSSWKATYREYLLSSDNTELTDGHSVFWLAYIDNDDIPELIIDTQVTAGGCYILTCHNGKVDCEIIGSNGISWYIERNNRLLDSAGQQGNYYDDVYSIKNGKWNRIYHAENYEYPSANYDIDHKLIWTYYIEDQKVSKSKYVNTLNSYFDKSDAIEFTNGISTRYLLNELE